MAPKVKIRILYVYKYLIQHTDEEHPATIADITAYLKTEGISAGRKTISADIDHLQEIGVDVVCTKSRQNLYFIGSRSLQLPELKLLVDAVQAAKFISKDKSMALIDKLSGMAGNHQAAELNRRLYIDGLPKTDNEEIYYTVDLLYSAINQGQQIVFKYREYLQGNEPVFKHDGQVYVFSPYDLVWSNDAYYVFGFSESHGKVVKFRVDRLYRPALNGAPGVPKPEDYDIAALCKRLFMMYDAEVRSVELLCENNMMKAIIDRFGNTVQTSVVDDGHFSFNAEVSVSPTFYAWLFTYAGKIRILSPQSVLDGYREHLNRAMRQA